MIQNADIPTLLCGKPFGTDGLAVAIEELGRFRPLPTEQSWLDGSVGACIGIIQAASPN